eukprot:CAMPEP_0176431924 /NCGR_PEP_ID=MMETSP0127-20121128/15084_1 /TAXON_ID=938130 /ORGANISM="Platyophrya macrostoma, Strain WH" /LENGTH=170 /DNA_ID=CAMNT_0017813989 /DNA_START=32 /DNA_END=544 /DNA_ORIENTATION=-
MSKPELKLQQLDEWMIRWRKYQTESDWQIEKNRQWWRQTNMGIAGAVFTATGLWTAGNATVNRWFGAPHFFDFGIDVAIKNKFREVLTSTPRYTPQGYGRVVVVGLPTYMAFVLLEHWQEGRRWNAYLKQNTVFGEQARRYANTGKIQEFLPVDIKATIPESQKAVYGTA